MPVRFARASVLPLALVVSIGCAAERGTEPMARTYDDVQSVLQRARDAVRMGASSVDLDGDGKAELVRRIDGRDVSESLDVEQDGLPELFFEKRGERHAHWSDANHDGVPEYLVEVESIGEGNFRHTTVLDSDRDGIPDVRQQSVVAADAADYEEHVERLRDDGTFVDAGIRIVQNRQAQSGSAILFENEGGVCTEAQRALISRAFDQAVETARTCLPPAVRRLFEYVRTHGDFTFSCSEAPPANAMGYSRGGNARMSDIINGWLVDGPLHIELFSPETEGQLAGLIFHETMHFVVGPHEGVLRNDPNVGPAFQDGSPETDPVFGCETKCFPDSCRIPCDRPGDPSCACERYDWHDLACDNAIPRAERDLALIDRAAAVGDPHLVTWDGGLYDFMGAGEFTLWSEATGRNVQVRLEPVGRSAKAGNASRSISTITAVATDLGGAKLSVHAGSPPRVYLRGVPVSAPDDFSFSGGATLQIRHDSLRAAWPNGDHVRIHLYASHLDVSLAARGAPQRTFAGLAGTSHGALVYRDATALADLRFTTLYPGYADAWRISAPESLFHYRPGENLSIFEDRAFPEAPSSLSSVGAQELASAEALCPPTQVAAWRSACLLDVALTGDASYAEWPRLFEEPAYALAVGADGLPYCADAPPIANAAPSITMLTKQPAERTPTAVGGVIAPGTYRLRAHTLYGASSACTFAYEAGSHERITVEVGDSADAERSWTQAEAAASGTVRNEATAQQTFSFTTDGNTITWALSCDPDARPFAKRVQASYAADDETLLLIYGKVGDAAGNDCGVEVDEFARE